MSSRENGALSKGPITEEGKRTSSQNAVRHGLLAQNTVLRDESQEAFADLFNHYVQSFDPQHPIEMDMIEELSSAYWRMRRLWAIETTLMNEQLALQPSNDAITRIAGSFSTLSDTNKFAVLNRYESRLHRIYQRALKNLLAIREKQKLPSEPT